jgi:hypothetical protein
LEIKEALNLGYKLIHITDVVYFETREFIFKDFVTDTVALKIENSGWPEYVVNDIQKKNFVEDNLKLGIKIKEVNMSKNIGLKTISKLLLNSLWGKFCQRSENINVQYVCGNMTQLDDMMLDQSLDVTDVLSSGDRSLVTAKRLIAENTTRCVNVIIGAFVTAKGRLELYKAIDQVYKTEGTSLMYTDTDSIIYKCLKRDMVFVTGNLIGQLKDEITDGFGMGAKVTEFVCLGPKTYSLKIIKENDSVVFITKHKGFTIDKKSGGILTHDNFLRLLREEIDILKVPTSIFQIGDKGGVSYHEREKTLRLTCDKRYILDDYNTRPWGWKEK